MGKQGKRRRFTAEHKTEAVKRLIESGKGLQEAADELGVHASQLGAWRNEQRAAGSAEALARQKAEAAELARLRREVKRLEQENEILKRAAPPLFSPGRRSRHEVPFRRRRAHGLPGAPAVPARRRGRERLLRLAAGDACRAGASAKTAASPPGSGRCSRPAARPTAVRASMRSCKRRVSGSAASAMKGGAFHRPMRQGGLVATIRRRFPRTADSDHGRPVAPNLLERKLAADRPDAVWPADISCLPTGEGRPYLAAVKAGPRRGPGRPARSLAGQCPTALGPAQPARPCGWPPSGGSRPRA